MKSDHVVFVKNQSDQDYVIQFDSRLTVIPKGKTVALPYYLAQHGLDQANNPLNKQGQPKTLVLLDEEEGSAAALIDRYKLAEEQALAAQEEARKKVEEAARLKKEAQMAKAAASVAAGTDKKDEPPKK